MKGLFVAGTDTGVGKTLVTALLTMAARERGLQAAPFKPVQTGCHRRDGELVAPDIEAIMSWTGMETPATPREDLVVYAFEPACSPHLAAALAGATLSLEPILARYRALLQRFTPLIVEGAGGVLVPLGERLFMTDLMAAIDLPVCLVARAGLGTLNHTLLTVEALERRSLALRGVVLVTATAGDPLIARDNAAVIHRHTGLPVVGPLPYIPALRAGPVSCGQFRAFFRQSLDELAIFLED